MADATPILLVGCGKMGGAMLAGWLDQGIEPSAVVAVEPPTHWPSSFAVATESLWCQALSTFPGDSCPPPSSSR